MTDEKKMEAVEKERPLQKSEGEWYDSLVRVVQEFLDFNMKTYKKEKAERLKA